MMRIAFGSDHAGYEKPEPFYKPALVEHLRAAGHEVIDCGTDSSDAVDYPDIADAVAAAVAEGRAEFGVLLCGTGIGMSIKANRHAGVRAGVCTSVEMAELAREHNDANVVCIGRRVLSLELCRDILDAFFATPASEKDRHRRRVAKMG